MSQKAARLIYLVLGALVFASVGWLIGFGVSWLYYAIVTTNP